MEQFEQPISEALRAAALALPETSEGTACVNRAFRVRKKNFLFVGEKSGEVKVMLKLGDSQKAASGMNDPRVAVGKAGWVTLRMPPDAPLPEDLLSAWVVESYRTLAPKMLVRQLDQGEG